MAVSCNHLSDSHVCVISIIFAIYCHGCLRSCSCCLTVTLCLCFWKYVCFEGCVFSCLGKIRAPLQLNNVLRISCILAKNSMLIHPSQHISFCSPHLHFSIIHKSLDPLIAPTNLMVVNVIWFFFFLFIPSALHGPKMT